MTAPKLIPMHPENGHTAIVKDIHENQATGYISLFRSIREHWIWQDPIKFQWWVDILMECNHADKKVNIGFELIECKRGQTLHSLLEWSKRWRVDISTVRRFLKILHSDGMIVPEPLSKTTRITVCNYDTYQQTRHDKSTPSKGKANAGQTPRNPNNNANKVNNENNGSTAPQKWLFSNDGFFDRQLANNAGQPLITEYRDLVEFLHGNNKSGLVFDNVLSLKKQISYKDFENLRETARTSTRTVGQVLADMENTEGLTKKYKNAYLTANKWLQNEFKK